MKKKKQGGNKRLQMLGKKLSWFKDNIDKTKDFYNVDQIRSLIEK